MPGSASSLLAVALAVVAATVLVACGEEDAELLPGGTAREITANLDTVKQLAGEGDCIGAESAAQQVSEQVDALGGVDRRLKEALREGAERLNEVVASCEEEPEEAIAPAEIPPEVEPEEEEKEKRNEGDEGDREQDEDGQAEPEEGQEEAEPSLPPQANGEGKGLDNGNGQGPGGSEEGGESPSGGVSPSAPVGGDD